MTVPNALSLVRIGLMPFAVWGILAGDRPATIVVVAAAMLTDFLDGWLARRLGQVSRLGKILDPVADKTFAAGVLGALVAAGLVPLWLGVVIVLRDVLVLGLGGLRIRGGAAVPTANLTGKAAFALLGVYLAGVVARIDWPDWLAGAVGAVYVLTALTYLPRAPRVARQGLLKEER